MASNLITCADSCLLNVGAATNCYDNTLCLCKNQAYLAAALACVREDCSASEQPVVIAYGSQECAYVGVYNVFSSLVASPTPAAATATAGADSPSTPIPSQAGTTPSSSNSGSGSGSGGLSAGDIAGIVSAAFGVLGVIIAILAWRLPHRRKRAREFLGNYLYPHHRPQEYQMATTG